MRPQITRNRMVLHRSRRSHEPVFGRILTQFKHRRESNEHSGGFLWTSAESTRAEKHVAQSLHPSYQPSFSISIFQDLTMPDRRQFLHASLATVGTLAMSASMAQSNLPYDPTGPEGAGIEDKHAALPWVDAHVHLSPHVNPITTEAAPSTTAPTLPHFSEAQWLALAHPEGVGRAVLVQHATTQPPFDNAYLIDAVKRQPALFRMQAMVDDEAPHPAENMRELLRKGATGLRITPFNRTPAERGNWLDTPGMRQMWETASRTGQAMCLLVDPVDLPYVGRTCARHPDTIAVIEHCARIGADGVIREADIESLCRLARHANTHVKLSAFHALGNRHAPYADLVPLFKRLFDVFGPERLMWGSDAPTQNTAEHSYAASIQLVRDQLDFLSHTDREWLLRKTAEKVFFYY